MPLKQVWFLDAQIAIDFKSNLLAIQSCSISNHYDLNCDPYTLGSHSLDLPLPHGLAPSETMVSDHGLNPPLSTENPRNQGFSGFGAPIFGFGLADPAPKG